MSTNPIGQAPSQFLVSTIQSGTTVPIQTVLDQTSIYFGYPISFSVDLYVETQYHSDDTTSTPFLYDANDIQVGDWFSLTSGKTYKVVDIINLVDSNTVTLEIEDYDLFILKSDVTGLGMNYPDEGQAGIIFEIDSEGMPILSNITQLSSQFPSLGYWVQDIQSRFDIIYVDIEGVPTTVDNDKVIDVATNGNGSATGLGIQFTPFADSKVDLKINGISCSYGVAKDFYFSNDGGVTARLMKDIEAGDELIWNGVNAGFELDDSDDIDLDYEAASNEV